MLDGDVALFDNDLSGDADDGDDESATRAGRRSGALGLAF